MPNQSSVISAGATRKRQLLDVAAKLFSTRGYQATGMRDIAEAVGIEPGSIYSHFKSKDDLLWNLSLECGQAFEQEVLEANRQDQNSVRRLSNMIAAHIRVVIAHQSAAAIFLQEWRHLSQQRRQEYSDLRSRYEQTFLEVIEAGQQTGSFRQTDSKLVTLALLSSLNWLANWYTSEGPLTQREITANLTQLFLNGITQSTQS